MRRLIPALLIVALFVFIVILLARSPAAPPMETPEAVETAQTTSTPVESPPPTTSTPSPSLSFPRTRESSTSSPTQTPTATTSTPAPPPPPAPTRVAHTIEADDNEFAPREIRVPRGATVSLTFRVRSTNVYYGGLDIRSTAFTTGTIPPGGIKTVSFVANSSFDFSSYWPLTNTLKTTGHVIVE